MAIYSLNLGFISRSEGRSSVGFSAYIGRGNQKDERTGRTFSYENRQNVLVSRVLLPEGAPEWMSNPAALWNAVEKFEDHCAEMRFRVDPDDPEHHQRSLSAKEKFLNSAQTAQTIMGAIPLEFTPTEAESCVEEFLKERFVSRGLVVEYAIHWDEGNPHFHGLITRRPLVEGEFSLRKDRDIVSKSELFITRKHWEDVVNKHLALGGHEVRIDSRSYADQGLTLLPTHHEGWYAQRLAERGEYSRIVADNDAIRQKNIEILCHNPAVLIQDLTLKRTIFTRRHIEEEVLRRVGGDEKLFTIIKAKVDGLELPPELILKQANDNRDVMFEGGRSSCLLKSVEQFTAQLLSNEEIIARVGEDLNRDPVFTSAVYKTQEDQIIKWGDELHTRQTKSVNMGSIEKTIKSRETVIGFELSTEQRDAITHLCSGPDICILNGKAGTGKTTLLKAVAGAYQDSGYHVRGTSFQGKAVEIMEKEIGIPCKTLDSFKYAWEKHQKALDGLNEGRLWGKAYKYASKIADELAPQRLTSKDVIIVDEANMVGNHLWEPFLKEATLKGAKVLIVQDPAQIKSRSPGDTGRLFAEKYGYVETMEVVRQCINWQRECSKLLNDHHVVDGLIPYHEKGHIHWQESETQTLKALTQAYIDDYLQNPQQSRMALAYRNADVYALNHAIREEFKSHGYLQEGVKLGGEEYAVGDRIRFTQNDHYGIRVKNLSDSPLQFIKDRFNSDKSVGVKNGTFGIIEKIEGQELTVTLEDERKVQFSFQEYSHITHGYALGIHKSEGSTFDKTFVMMDPLMDPSTLLVGLTRHREDLQLYVHREDFVDFKDLVDRIGRPALSQTTHDYHISEAQKPAFERVQQYRDLILEYSTLREEIEGSLDLDVPFYKHASYPSYQTLLDQKKVVAGEILQDWQYHAPYVRLAGIRKDILEVEIGLRNRILSDLEHRASLQVQGYMELVRETRTLWKTISATHPGVLASSHELYETYQTQKRERDSLAAVMHETPRLYSQFFKVTKNPETGELEDYWEETVNTGEHVYFASVKAHAAAHTKSQLQALFYERLTQEQKSHYDEVKAYVKARNEAAALYGHLKKQGEASVQVTSTPELNFEVFRAQQISRDTLALKIVESPEAYQEFFPLLNVKEDKLLEHAIAGELREKAYAYMNEPEIVQRAEKAQELQRILKTPQDYRIVNEAFKETPGADMNRIRFDIAFADKFSKGEIPASLSPDDVYKPIQDYLKASKETARAWKVVQIKGQDSPGLAVEARNENARILKSNPAAFTVLGGMGSGLQRQVGHQAGQIQSVPDFQAKIQVSPYISVDQVLEAAHGRIAEITQDLLGIANTHLSTKTILRFGNKGSLAITLSGPKSGLWKDFESGEGGNLFQLIQREKGLDFKGSVSYLAEVLNVRSLGEKDMAHPTVSHRPLGSVEESILTAQERASRLNAVSELHMKSTSIAGTVAETYLREERGIKGELTSAPQSSRGQAIETHRGNDLRYLPKGTIFVYQDERKSLHHLCLAAFGRDETGRLSSVQLIKLADTGERALTAEGEKLNKIQYGISKGSFVCVQDDASHSRVFIAEGIETALSLKEAGLKGKIVASLGIHNISNYQGPEREVVLCGDNDAPRWDSRTGHKENSQTHVVLEKACDTFQAQDKLVTIIKPTTSGDDFNDVLKKQGRQGVQDYLKPYLLYPNQVEGRPSSPIEGDLERQRNIQDQIPYQSMTLEKQILLDNTSSHQDALGLNHQFPEKTIDSQKETLAGYSSQSTDVSSNSSSKESSVDIISDYIQTKLKDIKDYAGTSLAEEVRESLKDYLHTLQKNEPLFEAIKGHDKALSQDLEHLLKDHDHEHVHTKDHGPELGM
jgi:ATP-dependent exoDNAse (exonuclease V) alpha subunit